MNNEVQKAIEQSPVWLELNAKVKAKYEEFGVVPSSEEYQAVRTMLICRTILDDENVRRVVSDDVWEQLQSKVH